MTSRNKPGVAFWAIVALVLLVPYPLSFGPACWMAARIYPIDGEPMILAILATIYRPLISLATADSNPASKLATTYAEFLPDGKHGRARMARILGLEYSPPIYHTQPTDIFIEPAWPAADGRASPFVATSDVPAI